MAGLCGRAYLVVGAALDLDLPTKWSLGTEEFAHVMAILSAQLFLRLMITLVFLLACPILGGVCWTVLQDVTVDAYGEPREGLRHGLPHWIRCASSLFSQLHLGPPLLTVVFMLPLNWLVHLIELQLYKILHLRCWCFGGNGRNVSRSDSLSLRLSGVHDLHTLQRKSLIITEITRRASMNPMPLLEKMNREL